MIKIRNLPIIVTAIVILLLIIIVINPMPVHAESVAVPAYISVPASDIANIVVDETIPKTGDDADISMYGLLLMLSVTGSLYIYIRERRQNND